MIELVMLVGLCGAGEADADGATRASPPASWREVENLEQLSLAELLELPVIGASRYEQQPARAPASITVLTARDLAVRGVRTLGQALRYVRGFFVVDDRSYQYVGTRGFGLPGDYNTRLLVLIDGMRLNDALYDSTDPGRSFPIPFEQIERIEVIRGPSSSVYGTSAFFGVINVITKSGEQNGIGAGLDVSSLGDKHLFARVGHHWDSGLELAVSGTLGQRDGHERLYFSALDAPETGDGVTRDADGEEYAKAMATARWRDLAWLAYYSARHKVVPTGPFGSVFPTDQTRVADVWMGTQLAWTPTLPGELELTARLTTARYVYGGDYLYDYEGTGDLTLNRDDGDGNWWGVDLQLGKRLADETRILLGVDFRDLWRVAQRNTDRYSDGSRYTYVDSEDTSRFAGAFLQIDLTFLDQVTVNGGARYDWVWSASPSRDFDDQFGRFNPRVAVIYHPRPELNLKLLFGRAFRAPNAYERFYTYGEPADGGAQLFNPALAPETITTLELVATGDIADNLRWTVAGYQYLLEDLIAFQTVDENDNLRFENSARVQGRGVELELDAKWALGVRTQLSYTLQRTQNQTDDTELTNSPRHQVIGGLLVPLLHEKVWLALMGRGMSGRLTAAATRRAAPHLLADLAITVDDVIPGLRASATAHNLFGTTYGDPAGPDLPHNVVTQDGRVVWVAVEYLLP